MNHNDSRYENVDILKIDESSAKGLNMKLKETDHDFFLSKNIYESFSEALENTYKSKELAKFIQNCLNSEKIVFFASFIL